MCDCIKEVTKTTSDHLVEAVEKQHDVFDWEDKGKFMNRGFSLSGGPTRIGMPFVIEYRKKKRNGQPYEKMTTEHTQVYPIYCPFCGEKYPEEKDLITSS